MAPLQSMTRSMSSDVSQSNRSRIAESSFRQRLTADSERCVRWAKSACEGRSSNFGAPDRFCESFA